MNRITLSALLLAVLISLFGVAHAEPILDRPAVTLVERARIGQKLPHIALAAAQRTVTFTLLVSTLGYPRANDTVRKEIHTLLPLYQERWDENIALAYEQVFNEEELAWLADEGRSSRDSPELAARQDTLGERLSVGGKPILIDLVAEALKNAWSTTH